jgi:hypothetical protein
VHGSSDRPRYNESTRTPEETVFTFVHVGS